MKLKGRCFKYGDDVNTDVIFPGKYTYTVTSRAEMAKHAMEDLDPDFPNKVRKGDVVVAGSNFGCGSSREQAVLCLREAGISAVVARSFSRIYFRNCINSGLVPIQTDAVDSIEDGEELSIDLDKGILVCNKGEFAFPPYTGEVSKILRSGGLIPYTRRLLGIEEK